MQPSLRNFRVKRTLLVTASILAITIAGCGGGGSDEGPGYSQVETHLGYENEASASRINYPRYINANSLDWNLLHYEEFRQLGALVDQWDQARRGVISLPETQNVPVNGAENSVFEREIRLVRGNWDRVGEECGYNGSGEPNSGCAHYDDPPKCSIYVPHQELYADGDIDDYHALLGHEMWHCLVGSFH